MANYPVDSTKQRMSLAALPTLVAKSTSVDAEFTLNPAEPFSVSGPHITPLLWFECECPSYAHVFDQLIPVVGFVWKGD